MTPESALEAIEFMSLESASCQTAFGFWAVALVEWNKPKDVSSGDEAKSEPGHAFTVCHASLPFTKTSPFFITPHAPKQNAI
jgi:hypothetical protein